MDNYVIAQLYWGSDGDFWISAVINYLQGEWLPASITRYQRMRIVQLSSRFCLCGTRLTAVGRDAAQFELYWEGVNSHSAIVSWARVPDYVACTCTHVMLNVVDEKAPAGHQGKTFELPFGLKTFTLPQLKTGASFNVKARYIRYVGTGDGCLYELDIAEALCSLRIMFSLAEVTTLGKIAVDYVRPQNEKKGMQVIQVFYRNKPQVYYDDVIDKYNGYMHPYLKDFNGDPGSPINGNISGLFFSGKIDPKTGRLPTISPFGEVRLEIPAHRLVQNMNLYFADFYCHYVQHYVTVVATRQNSAADIFCRAHLPVLNPFTNSFLQVNVYGLCGSVKISTAVLVELFYTESIDVHFQLMNGAYLGRIPRTLGRGKSKLEGIVKNPYCNICSLYPPPKRPYEDVDRGEREADVEGTRRLKARRRLPPEDPTAMTTGSLVPKAPAAVATSSLVAKGRAGVTTGPLVSEGSAAMATGSLVTEGPAVMATGSLVTEGQAAMATSSLVAEGRASVAAGSVVAKDPAALTADSLVAERSASVATNSLVGKGSSEVPAGPLVTKDPAAMVTCSLVTNRSQIPSLVVPLLGLDDQFPARIKKKKKKKKGKGEKNISNINENGRQWSESCLGLPRTPAGLVSDQMASDTVATSTGDVNNKRELSSDVGGRVIAGDDVIVINSSPAVTPEKTTGSPKSDRVVREEQKFGKGEDESCYVTKIEPVREVKDSNENYSTVEQLFRKKPDEGNPDPEVKVETKDQSQKLSVLTT